MAKYTGTGGVYVRTAGALWGFAIQVRRDLGACTVYGLTDAAGIRVALFVPPPLEQRVAVNDTRFGHVS